MAEKEQMRVFVVEELVGRDGDGGSAIVVAPNQNKALALLRAYTKENALRLERGLIFVREISVTKAHVAIDKLQRIS